MKVKTPKFRIRSNSVDGNVLTFGPNSSINLTTTFQLGVKNTNFGPYKYDSTTVFFYYGNTQVGSADLPKSKANFLSTKKVSVSVNISASTAPFPNETRSVIVPLSSRATLTGKVELMLIFKKKKSVNMNCTMEYLGTHKDLQNIKCK